MIIQRFEKKVPKQEQTLEYCSKHRSPVIILIEKIPKTLKKPYFCMKVQTLHILNILTDAIAVKIFFLLCLEILEIGWVEIVK